jgi:hypothetical protein
MRVSPLDDGFKALPPVSSEMLGALNSATKYPSIPTYHALDPKNGNLLEEPVDFGEELVELTEKIDGTNARLIFTWHDAFIGSREELLTCVGDVIHNPALGIVNSLLDTAKGLIHTSPVSSRSHVVVLYLELYGLKSLPAWKQYSDGRPMWRMFDVAQIPVEMLSWPREKLSVWRENGGQSFSSATDLALMSAATGILPVPTVGIGDGTCLPRSIEDMAEHMKDSGASTLAAFPDIEGRSEGLVIRTLDRKIIAKARFEDYERTLKRRMGGSR